VHRVGSVLFTRHVDAVTALEDHVHGDRRESDENISRDVQVILSDVRNRGDAALVEMTSRWDGCALASDDDWTVTKEGCGETFCGPNPDPRDALELAAPPTLSF